MPRIQLPHAYEDIISVENLLSAWQDFLKGKRNKADVREYSRFLMHNILQLNDSLRLENYQHGGYEAFKVSDPKPRDIHKAGVRDRLLHHAIYRQLYPFFDRTFIADSYSCRKGKGTHEAIDRFRAFARKVSRNHTRTCWVLKGDIRKFFASIDQVILKDILRTYIADDQVFWLLTRVIDSFDSGTPGKGLPLGNLTSQLLVNVYMNELDQYAKHTLKATYYIRYADDFVILSDNRAKLESAISVIDKFLQERLTLTLHPKKVSISTFASGVDFLGWVHFPDHRVLRTSTKRRALASLGREVTPDVIASYAGLTSHGNAHHLRDLLQERLSWSKI